MEGKLSQRITGRSVPSSHLGIAATGDRCAKDGATRHAMRSRGDHVGTSHPMSRPNDSQQNNADLQQDKQHRRRRSKPPSWSCRTCCPCFCMTLSLSWCILAVVIQTAKLASQYRDDAHLDMGHALINFTSNNVTATEHRQQPVPPDTNEIAEGIWQVFNITEKGAKPISTLGKIKWPSWQEIVQEKTLAARSLWNTTLPLPDAPMHLVRLNSMADNNNSSLPLVAIVTSTRSTTRTNKATETKLWKYLIKSILDTVTDDDRRQFRVHLFVAVDDIDVWWLEHCHELAQLGQLYWLPVTLGVYPKRNNHIPFNEMAYTAYQENATYFCRVNDDTQFLTKDWVTLAVKTLQSYDPPNIGVTGPLCGQGNTNILTHDFVHRHHMEIFGGRYYPPAFNNWYLDDWISFVYSSKVLGPHFHRFSVLASWQVKHWTSTTRYDASTVDAQWLPCEYERGRRLISSYVQEHFSDRGNYTINSALPTPALLNSEVVDTVLKVLPSTGNMLVWGLDMDSHFWHRATTGRVVFLNDHQIPENMEVTASQPYLEIHHVKHHLDRGAEAQRAAYEQFMNNSTAMEWCDWEMAQFPDSLRETIWDVVLVAAPLPVVGILAGMDDFGPGVFQSLYMTHRLVRASLFRSESKQQQSHIFVQHYQRRYERDLAHLLFPETPPVEVLIQNQTAATPEPIQEIAHFVLEAENVITEPAFCEPPPIRDESLFSDALWEKSHVQRIFDALPRKGGHLLVWGLEKTSEEWANTTDSKGRVVFLDDANNRGSNDKHLLEKYLLDYTTVRNDTLEQELLSVASPDEWKEKLLMTESVHGFPESELYSIFWNVILIHGPFGDSGRSQALYMSQILAQHNQQHSNERSLTHIFVMNYELREFDREFSKILFGREPMAVVSAKPAKRKNKVDIELAHFIVGDPDAVSDYKKNSAHGLVPWKMVPLEQAAPASPVLSPSSWIVLLQVSSGYADIFENWLFFYQKLQLGINVVVVAEDDPVYQQLVASPNTRTAGVQVQRSTLDLGGARRSFNWDEDKFKRIVSTRPHHILQLLQAGKSVIYTDADTVWRSSPLPYLTAVGGDEIDLAGHVDAETGQKFSPWLGTGFLAIASNSRTVRFMTVLSRRLQTPQLFQNAFNELLHMTPLVRYQPLPLLQFPRGDQYFETKDEGNNEQAIVVHNNFVMGHNAKVERFQERGLWMTNTTLV